MKNAADLRSDARTALLGNWPVAILTGFVASLMGAELASGGSGRSSVDVEELTSSMNPQLLQQLRPLLTFTAVGLILWGIVMLVIGGAGKLGYARFNLNLVDGTGASLQDLFSQFHRLGTGFVMNLLLLLYTFLWSLLFIIPGIVKSYSYAMTPYILSEHPELSANEAITESRAIMKGNKWRLFCLEFSFIGWGLLASLPALFGAGLLASLPALFGAGLLTAQLLFGRFGIVFLLFLIPSLLLMNVGFFFLRPYQEAARAAFYRDVAGGGDEPPYSLPFEL